MILLVSNLAIAWLVSEHVARREVSHARTTLLLCSLALSAAAGQCERWLTRALGVPDAAFRLHSWAGPLLANAIVLCAFVTIGFAHARRRRSSLARRAYARCVRAAALLRGAAPVPRRRRRGRGRRLAGATRDRCEGLHPARVRRGRAQH
jgi:hypothetical protein